MSNKHKSSIVVDMENMPVVNQDNLGDRGMTTAEIEAALARGDYLPATLDELLACVNWVLPEDHLDEGCLFLVCK